MTVRHHIGDDLLLNYASGALDEASSLLVATHLALCPTCRGRAERAEMIGGELLESLPPAELSTFLKTYADLYASPQNWVNLALVSDFGSDVGR